MSEETIEEETYHSELSKHPLYKLFFPSNIVFIGASLEPKMDLWAYLGAYREFGYGITRDPKIYPVNPKYEGRLLLNLWKFYKDLKSIPEPIDLVICAVRANIVPEIVKDCIKARVKFLIIFSSGFSEVGERGSTYTDQVKEILKNNTSNSIRVIGPNCFGPLNSQYNLNFNQTVLQLPQGGFSFFTQSGGFAHKLIEYSVKRSIGLNFGLSVGNMIDLDMNDVLEFYASDPKTKVIGFYLESVQTLEKSRKFLDNIRNLSKQKPIIIFKGGQSDIGARSCKSHTGAIAGSPKIYEAAFKQVNAIYVKNSEEFFDISHTLLNIFPDKLPKGRNVCAFTPGGGGSVELGDVLTLNAGAKFPEISEDAKQALTEKFYEVNTGFYNPLDLGAYGHVPDRILDTVKIVAKEPNIDIIVSIFFISRITDGPMVSLGFAKDFGRGLGRIYKKIPQTLFLIPVIDRYDTRTITELNGLTEVLAKNKIPFFTSINRLAATLKYLFDYCKI